MSITYTLNHGAVGDNVSVYEPPNGKKWKSAKTPSFALIVSTPVTGMHEECVIPFGGYWTNSSDSSTGSDLIFKISEVAPLPLEYAIGFYVDRVGNLHIPQSYLAYCTANSIVPLITVQTNSTVHPTDYAAPIYIATNASAYSSFIENAS